ncbi:MAG TPA: oligoendopeptidase F [Bacteroidales bacterium]|nr:oligoendopeptidase F [Bacteroidales bacterium]
MKYLRLKIFAITLFLVSVPVVLHSQKTREEIPDKYKWDLSILFRSDEEWNSALKSLASRLQEVEKFKGILTRSSADLLSYLKLNTELSKEVSRISAYVNFNADLDTRNMKYIGMGQQLRSILTDFSEKTAFADPEILSADWTKIEGFINSDPGFAPYKRGLSEMFRMKKHTLSEPEERIMSLAGPMSGTSSSVYNTFANAEMPPAEVTLSNGEKVKITLSSYQLYRTLQNREDRKKVFDAFWNNFENFKSTFGESLSGEMNSQMFYAKARHYNSTLEEAVDYYNIPVTVYSSLIENVNKNLPAFHRYLKIKKRMLGVDTLHYYDLYAPVVKDVEIKYNYDEGSKIVLEALKPLGQEYVSTVKKAIDSRWIDVYPTAGKQAGAYSSGLRNENLHPYILLNYNNLYDDVGTMAHELGHTMHSYLSTKAQPYPMAGYATFVAEVASTFNEVLLFDYAMKNIADDNTKLSFLMSWLDEFKGTLFRQTQFAEFEHKIQEAAWKGMPLTGESLSQIYLDIVRKYYGDKEGICKVDKNIEMEWAFISHFYMGYYVYQYSTSFTASISLAEKVLSGDKDALNKYLTFLSSGSSDYPIELLKKAGADMTTNIPFDRTIEAMNKIMDEIEKILDRKKN